MRRILVTGTVQHQLEANGVKWNTGGNMGWSSMGILSLPGSSEPPCGTLWGGVPTRESQIGSACHTSVLCNGVNLFDFGLGGLNF